MRKYDIMGKYDILRVGNVEYRTEPTSKGESVSEIVLWQKNHLYKNEDQLTEEGWNFDKEGNAVKGNRGIDASCFKDPMTCYTVARVDWNGSEFNITSVGTRAFDLGEDDFQDFKKILELLEYVAAKKDR